MDGKVGFGVVNAIVVILYLLFTLGFGSSFMKKASKNADAYFTAEGSLPGWAVGMSIFATTLSSITFMSQPEKSFNGDWAYAIGSLCIIPIIPILIAFYVPFFRKLHVTTAYEYLEERFDPIIRTLNSLLFVVYHLGRIAVVIYLPVLAIASVTTINPILVALAIGIICIIFTMLGGIEGVIWSDTIQGFILLGGAVLVIIVGLFKIDGGFSTVVSTIGGEDKFIASSNFDVTNLASFVPLIFIGQFVNSLYQYTGSQDVVQRYSSSKSWKETIQSLMVPGILGVVVIPLFFGMGSIIYTYYANNGSLPADFNTGAIVPYFVLSQLPVGLGGLIIAGIFAAAQSTVSSSLNSISACLVVDIKRRFFPKLWKNLSEVTLARIIVIIAGIIGTMVTVYFTAGNSSETWEIFLTVSGLFGVPTGAMFALGIFTERTNGRGALIGLIAGIFSALVANGLQVNALLVSTVAFIITLLVGYFASFLFPKNNKNVAGLTYKTRDVEYIRS